MTRYIPPPSLALAAPFSASAPPRRPTLRVPALEHWPEAIRSAERLRGTLVRCGPGLRPVAWPETPRVRLSALAPWLTPKSGGPVVAVGATAAWVWGAMRTPHTLLECSTIGRERRQFPPHSRVKLHHYSLDEHDIVWFGRGGVTTPARTLCDVLRSSEELSRVERVACRLLLLRLPAGRAGACQHLAEGARRRRQVARRRLAEL
ncbi:hypothetical protein [Leucobacter sp. USHLN153]|uniref:hypothetical protein n=1 Tax=Leucobacter sp. USHLN153 TaxID=3081268 RepID=UPI003018A2F5